MYISRVSGHRQATLSIQNALRILDPKVEAPVINGFGYTYPLLERIINRAYLSVIKRTPQVWDYLYDNPKIFKKSESIQKFLNKTSHAKIARLLQKYKPDAVVCTQAFPCGMVADYKKTHNISVKLVAVLTDYAPHSYWINDGVDYYVVPSAESRERFIAKGVCSDKIKIYGIPVKMKFTDQLNREPIAVKLGLDLKRPIILVMGGGQGLGPIKAVVKSLLKIKNPLQMIVLTGTNKKLGKWLTRQSDRLESKKQTDAKKILYYDFVKNVDELMEISTLIITKSGGMTTSECLAKGLPMVIVNPLPGQERRNTDFLLKNGIALCIDKTGDLGEEMEMLLKSPERLAAMRKAAFEHGRPHAAMDIARLILQGDAAE
jgi:processive 1,2-diacylglycerol beta-glucosyltransferase